MYLHETRNTSLKLCREADGTICTTKHTDTDWRAEQTRQHRRGAMLVGMDVIPPLVQHLHALTCQCKASKQIDSIGLSWNEFDRWCWCFVEISCCCEIFCHTTRCLHAKQAAPLYINFSLQNNRFSNINKLWNSHIVHFSPHKLCNKLNFAPWILCNKLKSSSLIQFIT